MAVVFTDWVEVIVDGKPMKMRGVFLSPVAKAHDSPFATQRAEKGGISVINDDSRSASDEWIVTTLLNGLRR